MPEAGKLGKIQEWPLLYGNVGVLQYARTEADFMLAVEGTMLCDDAIGGITRSAVYYSRGVFCPAEFWLQVLGRLTAEDAGAVLDGLPREAQEVLRGAYRERPWSLRSGSGYDEARRAVEDWCRGADV